jgi:tetratricopeptide (TPR) repeat protein
MLRQDMIRVCAAVFFASLLSVTGNEDSDRKTAEGMRLFTEAYRTWNGDGFAKATAAFTQASRIDPQSADARYWLGVSRFHRMLYFQHHDRAKAMEAHASDERESAIDAFEQLLKISPDHAEAHALLGTLLGMKIQGGMFRAMRYGPALQKHHKKALQSGPKNPRVRYLSGVGLYHVAKKPDDFRKALTELKVAEKLFAQESRQAANGLHPRWGHSSCLTFMGLSLEKLGRKQEAVAEFRRALALHPADHKAKAALHRLGTHP